MKVKPYAMSVLATAFSVFTGCDGGLQKQIDRANQQVQQLAEELDRRTTETGSYVRVKDGEIKVVDPWGVQIQVVYSQGGVAETLTVRSAGPDREFHTEDDIQAVGIAANLSGVGAGIKKNVEETSANAARGFVKGTVEGVKESLRKKEPEPENAK